MFLLFVDVLHMKEGNERNKKSTEENKIDHITANDAIALQSYKNISLKLYKYRTFKSIL